MNTRIQILSILLGLQLALGLFLMLRGSEFGAVQADQPLVEFDAAAVDHIRLQEGSGATLELVKQGDQWQLPGHFAFPASAPKVRALIDDLHALRTRMPVSTAKEAFARFKVADDQYERRIAFMKGDTELGVLYLGDSPGFKRLFARRGQSEAVFEVSYAAHQAGTKASEWTDKALFSLAPDQIVGLKVNGLALQKGEKGWQIEGDAAELNQEKVGDLVRDAANLNYLEVLGTEAKPEYKQDAPLVTLEVQPKEGDRRVYVISKPDAGQDYVLKAAHQPWYFKVGDWGVKGFTETAKEKLLKAPPVAEQPAEPAPATPPAPAEPAPLATPAPTEPPPAPQP